MDTTSDLEDIPPVNRVHRLCLAAIGFLLVGYALGGRGFAHLGSSPVFITDAVLALCLFLCLTSPATGLFLGSRLSLALIVFWGWGMLRTLPFIDEYGVDSLRDAALYGYGLFALMIGALMARDDVVASLLCLFDRVSTWTVIVLPLFILLSYQLDNPLSLKVPPVALKTGDTNVLLAGVVTFRLLGLRRLVRERRAGWSWVEPLFWASTIACLLWAFASRGGMLAFFVAIGTTLLLGRARRQVFAFSAVIVAVLFFLTVFGVRIEQDRRDVSSVQILTNVISIFSSDSSSGKMRDLNATASWRLSWWGDIVGYVVLGDYFWGGKGYGINLADSDGYQTNDELPLRSPHSAHMTILARSGVPGLILWLGLQIAFARSLLRMIRRMRLHGADGWDRICIWILAFWAASLTNGSFDVYLEGPQGGVWFWSIFGFGLAVLSIGNRARFNLAAAAPVGA